MKTLEVRIDWILNKMNCGINTFLIEEWEGDLTFDVDAANHMWIELTLESLKIPYESDIIYDHAPDIYTYQILFENLMKNYDDIPETCETFLSRLTDDNHNDLNNCGANYYETYNQYMRTYKIKKMKSGK